MSWSPQIDRLCRGGFVASLHPQLLRTCGRDGWAISGMTQPTAPFPEGLGGHSGRLRRAHGCTAVCYVHSVIPLPQPVNTQKPSRFGCLRKPLVASFHLRVSPGRNCLRGSGRQVRLLLGRCEVCGMGELICVKLILRILKPFLAVSRYARVETKVNEDSTEREGKGVNSLSLGVASSMCEDLVNSPRGRWHKESRSPMPCFFLDAPEEFVSSCEWPGGATLRHWSDLRGGVRGPSVSVEPWGVCASLTCLVDVPAALCKCQGQSKHSRELLRRLAQCGHTRRGARWHIRWQSLVGLHVDDGRHNRDNLVRSHVDGFPDWEVGLDGVGDLFLSFRLRVLLSLPPAFRVQLSLSRWCPTQAGCNLSND